MRRMFPVGTMMIAAAVLAVFSPAPRADETSHRKAAEDLLKATNVEKQLGDAIDQSVAVQVKANPQIAPKAGVLKKFFAKYLSWETLKDDLTKVYTDVFTEDELKQITAFYNTPVGKRVVAKMPELMGKGMELGVRRVQENQGELIRMLKEEDSVGDQKPPEAK